MKKILLAGIMLFLLLLLNQRAPVSHADDSSCDLNSLNSCNDPNGPCFTQLQTCSAKLEQALEMSQNATHPLESQLNNMQQQITAIETSVSNIEADLAIKKKHIEDGYRNIAAKQLILNAKIRDFYIKSYYNSSLLILLSSKSVTGLVQDLGYQRAAEDQDKTIITNVALSIIDLQQQQQELQNEEARLTALKTNLDAQSTKLAAIIQSAKAYQATLSSQIAQLSVKQQQLIAQKLASLNIPQTAYTSQGGCSSDINVDPGFSPRFALFTYGVPNRVGMSQYGALGRAQAGQSYTQILNAYYQNIQITTVSTSTTITVNGTNDYGESFANQQMNIEDYVKHLYEMPSSWTSEALKAQAVAARTYALAASNNGQTAIGADQHFQEIKTEINAQSWQDAVNATAGQVMEDNGQPIKAWFSSTHGGYEFTSSDIGWDGTSWTKEMFDGNGSVSSFSDLQNNAYDKNSPWFYCDWGSRSQYNNTAWLKSDELADIVNVVSLAKADSSTISHLSQLDKPNPDGTDTWGADRVRQELHNRSITAFSSISSVSIDWDKGVGKVNSINFSGDAGSVSFDGSTFKSFFNLRAPANVQIVGPLYTVEKK